MFGVYKRYPFHIPLRTKILNVFRFVFTFDATEKFLIARLSPGHSRLWRKFIPPLYFYNKGSIRYAERSGIRYVLDVSTLHGHSIYFYIIKDTAWDNLFKLIRPDFYIIDAGANIGFLSLYFAKECINGFVYSFEPDSDSFDSLQKSVNRNEFKNIKLFKTALGAEAGTAELFKVYVNNPGANRILSQKPDKETKSEIVEIATLDSFYQKEIFKKIDLIKIDVEGFELFVLRGARQLIDKWKPILFIELADVNLKQQNCSAVEVIEFVEGLGYHVLDAQTMLPIERKTTEYYTDIVCFSGDK